MSKSIKMDDPQPIVKSEQHSPSTNSPSSIRNVKKEEPPPVTHLAHTSTPGRQARQQPPIPHYQKVQSIQRSPRGSEHQRQDTHAGLLHQPSFLNTETLHSFLGRDPRNPHSFTDLPPTYHDLRQQHLIQTHAHSERHTASPLSGYEPSPDTLTHKELKRPRLANPSGFSPLEHQRHQVQQIHGPSSPLPGPSHREKRVLSPAEADAWERQHSLQRSQPRHAQQAEDDDQQFQQVRAQVESYLEHGAEQVQPATQSLDAKLQKFAHHWRPLR